MKEKIKQIVNRIESGDLAYHDAETELLNLFAVSGSLPTSEQSKKAMLRRKTKFVDNMDRFSSRKNAYKQGWQDCYNWLMSQGNDS